MIDLSENKFLIRIYEWLYCENDKEKIVRIRGINCYSMDLPSGRRTCWPVWNLARVKYLMRKIFLKKKKVKIMVWSRVSEHDGTTTVDSFGSTTGTAVLEKMVIEEKETGEWYW